MFVLCGEARGAESHHESEEQRAGLRLGIPPKWFCEEHRRAWREYSRAMGERSRLQMREDEGEEVEWRAIAKANERVDSAKRWCKDMREGLRRWTPAPLGLMREVYG